ncbi:MAG: hypothetical protein KAG66_19975, partial [Methylococcales bacterium]|nr:hypothetical protein [Methylococcales bacterium]
MLNSLQATLTDDSDYPAIENGAQGSYVAHYETALQQNGLQFTRTIDDGSFIEFHSQGDEPGIALTNSIQSFLDRDKGVFSRVSFHEKTNIMGDPNEIDLDTIEGVVLWGNTESEGLLRLTTVENTTAEQLAARAILTYHSADMGVVFSELRESSHGIDMETLDLDAELDALEADPTNAALFTRMTWIITAAGESDSDNTALEAIGKRLANEPANEDVALVYIDLLGHDGSWYSQDQLLPLIDPANGGARAIPERLQQQAIINLALVEVPQPATYAMIQAIRDDPAAAGVAQDMANEALGAMVPALRKCDPAAGEAIMADLELQLAAATTDQEKHQLLLALGNTESADLLPTVQPYLTSQNDMVQWAAYWALRDVPGQ